MQLPGIDSKNLETLPAKANMSDVLHSLEQKNDSRSEDVRKTLEKWGRVEIVEATFRGKSFVNNIKMCHIYHYD